MNERLSENIQIVNVPRLELSNQTPIDEYQRRNLEELSATGAVSALEKLRDDFVVTQHDSHQLGGVRQIEKAIIAFSENFRAVSILFNGCNNKCFEDGDYIKIKLGKDNDLYIGNQLIRNSTEMGDVLMETAGVKNNI
jgi:hypothetical protein